MNAKKSDPEGRAYFSEDALEERIRMSENRISELERTIERAWLLLGGSYSWNTALAMLPAGGIACERMVEIARDELGRALNKEPGLRGMRTEDNEPAPRDELDEIAEEIMGEAGPPRPSVGPRVV